MTRIIAAHIGSFPRIGEEKDQQRHRRAAQHLQSGELSKHAFLDVQHSVIQETIREQMEAGVGELTDGQISWNDPITKFCEKIKGIKIGGLSRFFDANFYYRVPVFTAKPRPSGRAVVDDWALAQDMSPKPVRAVLTGPFTLAAHSVSEIKSFDSFAARLGFFSEVLQEEVAALVSKGAQIIQIDEPSLAGLPQELPKAAKIFGALMKSASGVRKVLALYYSSAVPVLPYAQELPFDVVNLDFSTNDEKLVDGIFRQNGIKNIGFGVLNSRSTRMDPVDPILKLVGRWIEKTWPEFIYITPSTGLEYLPRNSAVAKLRLLTQIKREMENILGGAQSDAR